MANTRQTNDLIYSRKFVDLLKKPFEKWPAFERGIINKRGDVIKKTLSSDDKNSWTKFDRMTADVKKLFAKGPNRDIELRRLHLAYRSLREEFESIDDKFPIFEDMVSGDAGGNPDNIAAGKNSGAVVYTGPKTLNKKKGKQQMTEVIRFKAFVEACGEAKKEKEKKEKEMSEQAEVLTKHAFKSIGANLVEFEASATEIKTMTISGKTASKLVESEIKVAFSEFGKDGVLSYIKENTDLIWKSVEL